MQKAYLNGKVFTGENVHTGKVILVIDDTIVDLVPIENIPSSFEQIDLRGLNIAPAFIDLQIYGGNGEMFSINPTVRALEATYESCHSGGAEWFQATVATNSLDIMLQSFEAAKSYQSQGKPGLIGVHLEGPYINREKKGAQLNKYIRRPDIKEVEILLKEGEGVFTMMTLAPELVENKIIGMLSEAGVVLSVGHSASNYETAMKSFELGVTTATHLHNAMPAFKNREPGLLGAIFNSHVFSSIIPDGIHVDYASLAISKKILKERLFIITDAVTPYQSNDYTYVQGDDCIVSKEGILAGSCLTMMKAVQNCIQHAGIEKEEALRMASTYPARVINQQQYLGLIKKGYRAGFVIFDDQFNIVSDLKSFNNE